MRYTTDTDGTQRARRDDYLITPAMLERYTASGASFKTLEDTAVSLAEGQLRNAFGDDVIIDDVTVAQKGRGHVVYFDWHRNPEPIAIDITEGRPANPAKGRHAYVTESAAREAAGYLYGGIPSNVYLYREVGPSGTMFWMLQAGTEPKEDGPQVAPETLTLQHVHDSVKATYERVSTYRLIDVFPDDYSGLQSVLTLASRQVSNGATEYVVHRASQDDDYGSVAGGHYTTSITDAIANISARAGSVS
jgi:hypothetical protein